MKSPAAQAASALCGGAETSRIIAVGDSLTHDIAGARSSGAAQRVGREVHGAARRARVKPNKQIAAIVQLCDRRSACTLTRNTLPTMVHVGWLLCQSKSSSGLSLWDLRIITQPSSPQASTASSSQAASTRSALALRAVSSPSPRLSRAWWRRKEASSQLFVLGRLGGDENTWQCDDPPPERDA